MAKNYGLVAYRLAGQGAYDDDRTEVAWQSWNAAIASQRDAIIEECAKVCESIEGDAYPYADLAEKCEVAIRAMKSN